jgi:hypothetical protein
MQNPKLAAALEAAAKGFRVFPVAANSKIPAVKDWPGLATTDPSAIGTWWRTDPDFNIGIATGNGLVVVDVDTKRGAPGAESLDMLDALGFPESLRVATPSGGTHVYLRSDTPQRNRVRSVSGFPGVDIRGERGYVVGPGSTIDGKAYSVVGGTPSAPAVAPTWFIDILGEQSSHIPPSDAPLTEIDKPENIARAAQWLVERAPVATLGDGSNNTTYSVAAEMRARGLSEQTALGLLLDHWNGSKSNPPWPPEKLAVVVQHAFQYGQGAPGYKTAAGEFGALDIDVGEAPRGVGIAEAHDSLEPTEKAAEATLRAKPYAFVDPVAIPRREWLYGRHLMRKFVSVTVAPGGVGKSSLVIAEALAMVSGKPLLGAATRPLRVWYWNLEDPYDELQRRVQAAIQHFGLTPEDIEGRLFVNSGRESPLRIAALDKQGGARILRPIVDTFTAEMIALGIDVAAIDPFVSSHQIPENDTNGMDLVAKAWGTVADRANAAIGLVHHTRKQGGDEVTVESARGAKALTDAARDVRVLNRMSKEDGAKAGIENHRLYFRTYSDKANMAPPADHSDWFKLESVALANGDNVGVVVPWTWPDPFESITKQDVLRVQAATAAREYRESVQSKEWIGYLIAEVTGLDLSEPAEKQKVKAILREWLDKGWLKIQRARSEKGKDYPIVVAGKRLQETDFEPVEGVEN